MRSRQKKGLAKVQLECEALVVVIGSRQWREGVEVAKTSTKKLSTKKATTKVVKSE